MKGRLILAQTTQIKEYLVNTKLVDLHVEYEEQRIKHGILIIVGLFYEYMQP